jgi:hypothetical protein
MQRSPGASWTSARSYTCTTERGTYLRVKGINVDPPNPTGCPEPQHLARLGARWVRLVSRPGTEAYVEAAQHAGVLVLAVVARESAGFLVTGATVYQIGNEPDLSSESSWTMDPATYIQEWTTYRHAYNKFTMIAAGLASGQVAWWENVAPYLEGCAACAVHPYAQTVVSGAELLNAYRRVRPARAGPVGDGMVAAK